MWSLSKEIMSVKETFLSFGLPWKEGFRKALGEGTAFELCLEEAWKVGRALLCHWTFTGPHRARCSMCVLPFSFFDITVGVMLHQNCSRGNELQYFLVWHYVFIALFWLCFGVKMHLIHRACEVLWTRVSRAPIFQREGPFLRSTSVGWEVG